jgi:hypothetical protein
MKVRRVVICGSMTHYRSMLRYRDQLLKHGIPTIVPSDESKEAAELSFSQFQNFKRVVSRKYLEEIRRTTTFGILVVNEPKRGISNYIGANSFAEIAVAFTHHKRIFLLHDLYDTYVDELLAWRVVPLHGNIGKLVELFWHVESSPQLELFQWEDAQVLR